MKFLVTTDLVTKRHRKTGRALGWRKVKRIVVASSHEEAKEIDDAENMREYGTNDYGIRVSEIVPNGMVHMKQLEFAYSREALSEK